MSCINVIHVSTGSEYPVQATGAGGVEKAIFHLCLNLFEQGHRVWVVDRSLSNRSKWGVRVLETWMPPLADRGIPRHLVRLAFFCSQVLQKVNHVVAQRRVDVIHTHSQFSVATVLLGRRLFGWRSSIVHTLHNPWILYADIGHRLGTQIEQRSLQLVDCVTVPTAELQRIVIDKFKVRPSRVAQVRMGIDLGGVEGYLQRNPTPVRRDPIVLYSARISRRKNQMAIVKAAPHVLAECPDARFIFCGPVDDLGYMEELQANVKELRLGAQVEFRGYITTDELYGLYRRSSVFAFPSLAEIQPVALLEAIAFDLPVIASPIPVHEEVLTRFGDPHVLVDPEDTARFASRIVEALTSTNGHDWKSTRARKVLDVFTWHSSAVEMANVYGRILSLG